MIFFSYVYYLVSTLHVWKVISFHCDNCEHEDMAGLAKLRYTTMSYIDMDTRA